MEFAELSTVTTKALEKKIGRINQGDCIRGMSQLPDGAMDLVFADPPFNIGYDYDEYEDQMANDEYLEWSAKWMQQVYRVLKPDGTFWLAIGDEYAAELKIAAQKVGFHPRNWVIWHYTFGVHCKGKFTRSHAHLFYFTKDARNFTFSADEVAVPSARQLIYADSRANPKGRMPDDTWILRPQDCVDGFTPDEDSWYFPRVAGTFKERAGFHGCQMPEQLLGRIIRACSRPGELVMDPFSGSATTLVVAKKLRRKFMGFELSSEYTKLGTQRLESVADGDFLEGSEEPKVVGVRQRVKKERSTQPSSGKANQMPESIAKLCDEMQGLLEAFGKTNRGFSLDRLVLDPVLNGDFQDLCDGMSLPGSPMERNRFLFRLRKAGKLKNSVINTSIKTCISWNQVEPYLFASEIAWKRVSDLYANVSLDEIFCDPRLAEMFDEEAKRLAPGYSSLQYRWAALRLRKENRNGIRRESEMTQDALGIQRFDEKNRRMFESLDLRGLPDSPAVYAIGLEKKSCLYLGETSSLRTRLTSQLDPVAMNSWDRKDRDPVSLSISFIQVSSISDYRFARQFKMQKWYRSEWNRNHVPAAAS